MVLRNEAIRRVSGCRDFLYKEAAEVLTTAAGLSFDCGGCCGIKKMQPWQIEFTVDTNSRPLYGWKRSRCAVVDGVHNLI